MAKDDSFNIKVALVGILGFGAVLSFSSAILQFVDSVLGSYASNQLAAFVALGFIGFGIYNIVLYIALAGLRVVDKR